MIDGVVLRIPVQVHPPAVPRRVARHEPACPWIIIPLVQVQQTCLRIRVVPFRTPVAERVIHGAGLGSVGIVQVRGERVAAGVQPLGDVAALVEGVEHAAGARAAARVAGEQAAPEGVGGKHGAAGIKFADRVAPVVEEIGRAAAGLLPRPQAACLVASGETGAGNADQAVVGIEDQRAALVADRVAVAVVGEAAYINLNAAS